MSAYVGVGLALASAVAIALLLPRVLRLLPPPPEDPPDYAALATPRFRLLTAAVALAAGLVVAWRDPHPWLWLPLVAILIPACAVDARTSFLPLRLTQAGWFGTALATLVTAGLARDAMIAGRAILGGIALGLLFYAAWRARAVGFGDVRLMISVGAVCAAVSFGLLLWALLAGTLVGAATGLVRLARGRGSGPFPYGPGLVAGPFIALALGAA